MTDTTALDHPLVRDYLRRLDRATKALPPDERRDVREGIRGHLVDALAGASGEADIRNVLEALGEPEEIVPQSALPPVRRRGALEIAAVILLAVGSFMLPIVGWFIGVVLLWVSTAWTTGQKVLGTLIWPGGLAAPLLLAVVPLRAATCATEGTMTVCEEAGAFSHVVGFFVFALALLAPIAVAVYLLRTADRTRHA